MLKNLIQNANIIPKSDWQKTWYTRQERIKKEGSEYFTWPVPATAAAARSSINVSQQFPRSRKYAPLDWLEIVNNDVVNLTLTINGSETLPVPAGTIRVVDNKALHELGVTNNDAATTSVLNDIIVSLRRQPTTIDKWARGQ
tara:strand:- start:240 stop:665 length:426 start_codon:yes stop_codon:yes gene_type:complete